MVVPCSEMGIEDRRGSFTSVMDLLLSLVPCILELEVLVMLKGRGTLKAQGKERRRVGS